MSGNYTAQEIKGFAKEVLNEYFDGKAREQSCPWCHAERIPGNRKAWQCGTRASDTSAHQTDQCRIRELELQVNSLRDDNYNLLQVVRAAGLEANLRLKKEETNVPSNRNAR